MMTRDLARVALLAVACYFSTAVLPAHAQDQDSIYRQKEKSADSPHLLRGQRNRMVDRHLAERGIKNKRVLDAFRTVPRHKFLPQERSARLMTTSRFRSVKGRRSPLLTTWRS